VPYNNATIIFKYNAATHILMILAGVPDNNIAWDGLKHDSRDTLYRTPGGAVEAGSTVLVRFRTFHNDVTSVSLRTYDLNASGQSVTPMTLVAADVPCYPAELDQSTCDYWETAIHKASPNNLWYRFIVTDSSKTVYYADNTAHWMRSQYQ
jgi:hypothetical protein